MNKIFENFKTSLSRRMDRDPFAREPRPERDWVAILCLFFVLLLISSLVHSLLFVSWNKDAIIEPEKSSRLTIDRELLGEMLEAYRARAREFNKLEQAGVSIQDPSI